MFKKLEAKERWPTPTVSMATWGDLVQAKTAGNSSGRPSYAQAKSGVAGALNAVWLEAMMGWPAGWTDLRVRCEGVWNGWPAPMGAARRDGEPPVTLPQGVTHALGARLKAIGNGVVPQVSESAFYTLLAGPR